MWDARHIGCRFPHTARPPSGVRNPGGEPSALPETSAQPPPPRRVVRPCAFSEALCLTHEGSAVEEHEPYLAHALAPLRVLTLYGRCARMDPPVHVQEAVYWFWMDRVRRRETPAFVH